MINEETIAEQKERLNKAKRWGKRIMRLRKRKNNPLNEAEFCEKYGFNKPSFNRNKTGKRLPTRETVDRVEKALAAEGV